MTCHIYAKTKFLNKASEMVLGEKMKTFHMEINVTVFGNLIFSKRPFVVRNFSLVGF